MAHSTHKQAQVELQWEWKHISRSFMFKSLRFIASQLPALSSAILSDAKCLYNDGNTDYGHNHLKMKCIQQCAQCAHSIPSNAL